MKKILLLAILVTLFTLVSCNGEQEKNGLDPVGLEQLKSLQNIGSDSKEKSNEENRECVIEYKSIGTKNMSVDNPRKILSINLGEDKTCNKNDIKLTAIDCSDDVNNCDPHYSVRGTELKLDDDIVLDITQGGKSVLGGVDKIIISENEKITSGEIVKHKLTVLYKFEGSFYDISDDSELDKYKRNDNIEKIYYTFEVGDFHGTYLLKTKNIEKAKKEYKKIKDKIKEINIIDY